MISVVIPVLNEEENIPNLVREIDAAAQIVPITEMIFIDDASTDSTQSILKSLQIQYPAIRILRHDRRSGQSAGLWAGVKSAHNEIIVTLDGDGQNDPADILALYNDYLQKKNVHPRLMIAGQRKKRQDTWARRWASRFANKLRAAILKDRTRDTGCSLKLFLRSDYMQLPYFNHMHRFLPALMLRQGVELSHIDVNHRARKHGVSKYNNLHRALVGIADLMGVWWLQQRPYTFPNVSEEIPEKG